MTDADKLRTFITQLSPVAESYGKKSVISNINAQIADLEKSTSVLFCGEFKRGKSSLVNAIIGETLCPTDVGIATSVVSIIRYGAEKKAYRYYGNLLEDADALKKEEIGLNCFTLHHSLKTGLPLSTLRVLEAWIPGMPF